MLSVSTSAYLLYSSSLLFINENLTHATYIFIDIFSCKILNFHIKNVIFAFFAQNIDYGYKLEPPCRGSSNYVLD